MTLKVNSSGQSVVLPVADSSVSQSGSLPSSLQVGALESVTQVVSGDVNSFGQRGENLGVSSSLQQADTALTQARPAMSGRSVLSLLGQGIPAQSAENLFGLIPGRVPNAVGLDQVLESLPRSPQGEQALRGLIQEIEAKTGIPVEPAMVDAILAKPTRLANLLMLTPAQLSQGIEALNERHRAQGGTSSFAPRVALPATVEMGALDQLSITRPEAQLKEIAPGLLQGDIKSDLSDQQAKTNMAMAAILDKLVANGQRAEGSEPFRVNYQGQSFDRIDTFLQALRDDGHDIQVSVKQRVANFSNLKTKGPDGSILDVPAPLFVQTGAVDDQGRGAAIPAIHSELVISIRKTDATQGTGVDADLKWYQGISGTGFFADKLFEDVQWAGGQTRELGSGNTAIEAIQLAGLMSDTINASAQEQGLWLGGYGKTGVCNDSVAVIEHAMTGKNLTYPLLMQDDMLLPELQERIQKGGPDTASFERLVETVNTLPSDMVTNETSFARAASSIPWAEGQEPFQSSVDARRILEATSSPTNP